MPGVNESGFEIKSFDDIKTQLEASFRSIFGNDINLESTSLLGQQIGIFSKELYDLWQAGLDKYQSRFPATSFGISLDHIISLAGLERKAGFKTSGFLYLVGDAGTIVPSGTLLSTAFGYNVETLEAVILAAGTAPILKISKEPGNLSSNFNLRITAGIGNFFVDVAGNSQTISFTATSTQVESSINALFGGNDVVDTVTIASNEITITFSDPQFLPYMRATNAVLSTERAGLPNGASVGAVATDEGPIIVQAFDVIEINTPVNGLTSVINTEAFVTGRFPETDIEARRRWDERVEAPQVSSGTAIRNAVKNLDGVSQALVFDEPGQIEVVVSGGEDNLIGQTIQEVKTNGILTTGTQFVIVNDDNGNPKRVYFSRPTIRNVFVKVAITKGNAFPLDGEAQVRGALINFVNFFTLGGTVRPSPDMVWSLEGIRGINNLSILISETGADGSFSDDAITLQNRERVAFSSIDITVT